MSAEIMEKKYLPFESTLKFDKGEEFEIIKLILHFIEEIFDTHPENKVFINMLKKEPKNGDKICDIINLDKMECSEPFCIILNDPTEFIDTQFDHLKEMELQIKEKKSDKKTFEKLFKEIPAQQFKNANIDLSKMTISPFDYFSEFVNYFLSRQKNKNEEIAISSSLEQIKNIADTNNQIAEHFFPKSFLTNEYPVGSRLINLCDNIEVELREIKSMCEIQQNVNIARIMEFKANLIEYESKFPDIIDSINEKNNSFCGYNVSKCSIKTSSEVCEKIFLPYLVDKIAVVCLLNFYESKYMFCVDPEDHSSYIYKVTEFSLIHDYDKFFLNLDLFYDDPEGFFETIKKKL